MVARITVLDANMTTFDKSNTVNTLNHEIKISLYLKINLAELCNFNNKPAISPT